VKTVKATAILRGKLGKGESIIYVGAQDLMSAKLIERTGFDAVSLQSWQMSFGWGLPDVGIIGPYEVLDLTRRVAEQVKIPILVDFEQGWGSAANAAYWTRAFERAGASMIHIDDYEYPHKCPDYAETFKGLEPIEVTAGKIRAICDSREDKDFMVMVRTWAGEPPAPAFGLDKAVRRSKTFVEAGADAIMVHVFSEGGRKVMENLKAFRRRVPDVPLCVQIGSFNKELCSMSFKEIFGLGYQIIGIPTEISQVSAKAVLDALKQIRAEGRLSEELTLRSLDVDTSEDMIMGRSEFLRVTKKHGSK
jgi:2-methylisocitrate lyase-like PEP mutase family enzyme